MAVKYGGIPSDSDPSEMPSEAHALAVINVPPKGRKRPSGEVSLRLLLHYTAIT